MRNLLYLLLLFLPQVLYSQKPLIPERQLELWEYKPVWSSYRDYHNNAPLIICAYNIVFHPLQIEQVNFNFNNIQERFFINNLEFSKGNFLKMELKQADVSSRPYTLKYPLYYHDSIIGTQLIRTFSLIIKKPVFILDGRKIRKHDIIPIFESLKSKAIEGISRKEKFIFINNKK